MFVTLQLAQRMLRQSTPRGLWKFAWNFGFKGMRSVQKFKRRLKQGRPRVVHGCGPLHIHTGP